jgi:anti-anti-sigma factor
MAIDHFHAHTEREGDDITFIDSTGLAALIGAHERLQGAGVPTRFVRGSDDVQRVFAVAGLDEVLDFVDPPPEDVHPVT